MSESTEVIAPWSGMTREAIKAILDAKTLVSEGAIYGAGQLYIVQFSGAPMFVPVEHFDGFAASILGAN